MGHLGGCSDKLLVLNQIAFDVEIIVPLKIFLLQVLGLHLQGGAHVVGEGAFGVGAGNKRHAPAGRFGAVEHGRFHAALLHGTLEEAAQFIVADLADIGRRHAENGGAGDGVCGRSARDVFHAQFLQRGPDAVAGFHVDVLHAAFGQMVFFQQRIVRKDGQDVGEGVANSKDRFHATMRGFSG